MDDKAGKLTGEQELKVLGKSQSKPVGLLPAYMHCMSK
jgi:hypothetical protein